VAGKSDHWVESQLPGRLRRALDPGHPAPGATYDALKNRIRGTVLKESDALTLGGGPLGLKNSATFSGGRYATIQLDRPITVYRAWTPGQSREFGQFWALEKPIGSLQTRIDSALLPEWGKIENTPFYAQATHWVSIKIPAGTVIHIGEVGSQGGAWLGAKSQLLIKGGPQDAWRTGQGLLQQ
jgi:filamentous hemagglutinin